MGKWCITPSNKAWLIPWVLKLSRRLQEHWVYQTTARKWHIECKTCKTMHTFSKVLGQLPSTLIKLNSSVVCEIWLICQTSMIHSHKSFCRYFKSKQASSESITHSHHLFHLKWISLGQINTFNNFRDSWTLKYWQYWFIKVSYFCFIVRTIIPGLS